MLKCYLITTIILLQKLENIESFKLIQCSDNRSKCIEVEGHPDVLILSSKIKNLQKSSIPQGINPETVVAQDGNLTKIAPGIFENFTKVKRIFFGSNYIKRIPYGVFNNLTPDYLDLGLNFIDLIETEAFSGMKELKTMRLYGNKLKSFESAWFSTAGEKNNIQVLSLDHNYIKVINRKAFKLFPKLAELYLQINEIEYIASDAFENNLRLKILDLSRNHIMELNPNIFQSGVYIEKFIVSFNYLNYIQSDLFQKIFVRSISIDPNLWYCSCLTDLHKSLNNNSITIFDTENALQYKEMNKNMPICADTTKCQEIILNEIYKDGLYEQFVKNIKDSYENLIKAYGCTNDCVKCRNGQCWKIDDKFYFDI